MDDDTSDTGDDTPDTDSDTSETGNDTFDTNNDALDAGDDADDERVRHDWRESERPSVGVTEAAAVATGRSVSTLPPLHGVIAPEALDALVTDGGSQPVTVDFSYAGHHVCVHTDGTVLLTPE